ncbi:hypothetical protein [Pedobacter sp. WC2423]|uniref:hypothetical protein n=1 Tax=Pedobacter sp. WC2423 TaxID=3234142 RepID=UPI003466A6F8
MEINVKNQEYLNTQVFYTGFGDTHRFEIGEGIASLNAEKNSFSVAHSEKINGIDTFTNLNFIRGKGDSNMVFFNSYDFTLMESGKEPLTQNFRVQNWQAMEIKIDGETEVINGKPLEKKVNSTISKKEAFNAMQGRYPLKEFIKEQNQVKSYYKAHIKVDFNDKLTNGDFKIVKLPDFDFESKIDSIPIKDLDKNDNKSVLIESLEKGNIQSVLLLVGGEEVKHFLALDAVAKTIAIYDSGMNRLGIHNGEEVKTDNKITNEESKKNNKQVDTTAKKTNKSRRKGKGI